MMSNKSQAKRGKLEDSKGQSQPLGAEIRPVIRIEARCPVGRECEMERTQNPLGGTHRRWVSDGPFLFSFKQVSYWVVNYDFGGPYPQPAAQICGMSPITYKMGTFTLPPMQLEPDRGSLQEEDALPGPPQTSGVIFRVLEKKNG